MRVRFPSPLVGEGGEMRFGIEPDEGSLPLSRSHLPSIVIPAKAGIQLHVSAFQAGPRLSSLAYAHILVDPRAGN
jgi:hypothetical protein